MTSLASMEAQSPAHGSSGRVPILVVATGGSSGLGFEALATYVKQSENDITLVLGCRNPVSPLVSTRLREFQNVRKLDIFELELTSNDSIRGFAAHILETYSQQISVLLLCAGAMCGTRIVDSSGIEQTLQVNALSQGLLLECLWLRLIRPVDGMVCSRVVFVASSLHKKASQQHEVSPSSIDTLLDNKPWKPLSVYSITKLVQMHLFKIVDDAFAKVGDSKLRPIAIAVSPGESLSNHPKDEHSSKISNLTGFVPQTGLVREYSWLMRQLMAYIMPMFPFTTSLEEGKSHEECFSREK
ncbi:unnamed protein product [Rhizoctonia solani]|uniref:Uncharacterized protein n=1 Tax=Rhizoctonia solani TaxID=456999 RepID=A0A8H3DI77_9AGAM|nr:unnamed protein product [Rhizoctonia solani]